MLFHIYVCKCVNLFAEVHERCTHAPQVYALISSVLEVVGFENRCDRFGLLQLLVHSKGSFLVALSVPCVVPCACLWGLCVTGFPEEPCERGTTLLRLQQEKE